MRSQKYMSVKHWKTDDKRMCNGGESYVFWKLQNNMKSLIIFCLSDTIFDHTVSAFIKALFISIAIEYS